VELGCMLGDSMKKAVRINTDGSKEVIEFTDANAYSTFSGVVDGYIQQIYLDSQKATMYINEEGKLLGLDQNTIGTALWVDEYDETDIIMGNIVILGYADDEGYDLSLTDDQIKYFMEYDKHLLYFNGTWNEINQGSVVIDTGAWDFELEEC
jgi:hypothetical protein